MVDELVKTLGQNSSFKTMPVSKDEVVVRKLTGSDPKIQISK